MIEKKFGQTTCVISMRIDNRDFARLLLFWNKQGQAFASRSALIVQTILMFLMEHSVEEVTYLQAGNILSDERYIQDSRQKSISYIVERAHEQMHSIVQEALSKSPENILMEDVLQEIPEEPSTSEEVEKPKEKKDET
jgi:hypothetical protein